MFADVKKQHIIMVLIMLAILFGGGVKYGRYLEEKALPPVSVIPEGEQVEERNDQSGGSSKLGKVTVHVAGAVKNPGVFTLEEGSRVIDAVNMAGPEKDADLDSVNLAKKLVDQEKIPVPVKMQPGTAGKEGTTGAGSAGVSGGAGDQLININFAGTQELETLPGIGPAKAQAIIRYREENGFFQTVEDIDQVPGIGPATLKNIQSKITI